MIFEKYAYLLVTHVIPLFFLNRTHCSTTTVNNATMIARRRPVVEPKVTGERHDVATSALFSYKSDTKMKACKSEIRILNIYFTIFELYKNFNTFLYLFNSFFTYI